ncbi:hypothetical protein BX600DRAFT_464581 [Xylariales sp. PMI_506]|nr:hypothetical protein BX600DRAFT_464581 [Xylariales sp. PMI_506]
MDKCAEAAGGESPAEKDSWAEALERLSTEDRGSFSTIETPLNDPQEVLVDVLAAVQAKKEESLRKRWKVVVKGRTIIVRDILEKISAWVKKMMAVGDSIVQLDASFTSTLPWAAVKLILQAGMNEMEVFGFILQSLDSLTNTMARCKIVELLYPRDPESSLSAMLSKALVSLYTCILEYLSHALHFYQTHTVVRVMKSLGEGKSGVEGKFQAIEAAQNSLWSLVQLAEGEKSQKVQAGLDGLEAALRGILGDLEEPISRILTQVQDLHDGLERETRAKILRSISTIPYSTHHKTARSGRLEGSGQWLLTKPAYQSWRKDSSSSVLWLHGIPGSGKTKLASLVVDQLSKTDNLAYFYCMRNPAQPERAQCSKILASLVRQLTMPSPDSPVLPAVVDRYEEAIAEFVNFDDLAATIENSEVLLELLAEYPSVTIVIDALDEVDPDDRQELMDVLSFLMQNAPNLVKIMISSRDNYDIALHLHGSPNVYIDADDNAADIEKFINAQLTSARLLRGKLPDDLKQEITNTLLTKARGMFRWVDLQIQSLRHLKLAADIQNRLGVLPETLEGSYWEIFKQIQESGEHAAALAEFTFQWLLYAIKSISINEFAAIASSVVASGTDSGFSSAEIVDVCSNLVVMRSDSFDFAHLSVREFLERLPKREINTYLPDNGNARIAEACLNYLISQIKSVIDNATGKPNEFEEKKRQLLVDFGADPDFADIDPEVDDNSRGDLFSDTQTKAIEKPDSEDKDGANNVPNSVSEDCNPHASQEGTESSHLPKDEDTESQKRGISQGTAEAEVNMLSDGIEHTREDEAEIDPGSSDDENETGAGKFSSKQGFRPRKDHHYYAATQWPKHVSASKELRKKAPLADAIHNFLLDPSRSSPSESFQLWTLLIRALRFSQPFDDNVKRAVTKPSNPVWIACYFDWPEIIEFVYQTKSEALEGPSYPAYSMDTVCSCPWEYALVSRKIPLVEALIRCGADRPMLKRSQGELLFPLERAAAQNDIVLLSLLLKNAAHNIIGLEQALIAAALKGHIEVLTKILDEIHDIESSVKFRALYAACQKGQAEAASLLLERGAPVVRGSDLLCQAVLYQRQQVVRMLLERNIGLNGLDRALTLAVAENMDADTTALLKERGAKKEDYAIARAIRNDSPDTAARLIKVGYPLQGGRLEALRTELHMAAQRGLTKVVQAILERDDRPFPVDVRDRDGLTPLHLAARSGNAAIVQLLLGQGADVLAEDDGGSIPLDYAEMRLDQSLETPIRQRMEQLMSELRLEGTQVDTTRS